jgi:hypothetical protein
MANAQVEELKPMTEDDMRVLVRRYYATMRGGEPNPAQVEQSKLHSSMNITTISRRCG